MIATQSVVDRRAHVIASAFCYHLPEACPPCLLKATEVVEQLDGVGRTPLQAVGQQSLLDGEALPLGSQGREDALRRVEAHASKRWLAAAAEEVGRLAAAGEPFVSDDVIDRIAKRADAGGLFTPDPRALGGVFAKAARAGLIRATGEYRRSGRASNHGRPQRVWFGA